MKKYLRLCDMQPNDTAVVRVIETECAPVKRMKDMGINIGETISCLFSSPFSDPVAYRVNGITVALRKSDCSDVWVSLCEANGGNNERV